MENKWKKVTSKNEVPVKPVEVEEDFGYFICGNCSFTVGYGVDKKEHRYCMNCGQRIDWRD